MIWRDNRDGYPGICATDSIAVNYIATSTCTVYEMYIVKTHIGKQHIAIIGIDYHSCTDYHVSRISHVTI